METKQATEENQKGGDVQTPRPVSSIGLEENKSVSPIIDVENPSLQKALLAVHNPRAALAQIRMFAKDAKQMMRNGDDPERIFGVLNSIVILTGDLS